MKPCAVKDNGHTYMFDLNHYFVEAFSLNMVMLQNFEVILGQMLNHPV
jgi:hypothetical protein